MGNIFHYSLAIPQSQLNIMKCEKCSAEIVEGAKFCTLCKQGKKGFEAVCPYCGSKMSHGKARIKSTLGGMLLAGFSYQHLFFEGSDRNENIIMRTRSEKEAYLCENCEGLFILS